MAPLTDLPQMALADQQTPLPAQADAQKTLQAEQQHAGVYVPASDETLPIIPPQQDGQAQASNVVLNSGGLLKPRLAVQVTGCSTTLQVHLCICNGSLGWLMLLASGFCATPLRAYCLHRRLLPASIRMQRGGRHRRMGPAGAGRVARRGTAAVGPSRGTLRARPLRRLRRCGRPTGLAGI